MRRGWLVGLLTLGSIGASQRLIAERKVEQPADARPSEPVTAGVVHPYPTQKVVYQISDDGGIWNRHYIAALNNMRNHVTVMGRDKLELVVVLHSDGVNLLLRAATDQRLQGYIANLKEHGVKFLVCAITLTSRKIDPHSLFEVFEEDIVPSGVVEIAYLQQQGFAYIRP